MRFLNPHHSRQWHRQFICFAAVGTSGLGVGLAFLNLFMWLTGQFLLSNVLTFFVAVTWNFAWNWRLTFGKGSKPILVAWFEFAAGCFGGALLNWAVAGSLYHGMGYFTKHYNQAALIGTGAAVLINFLWARQVVFRRQAPAPSVERQASEGIVHGTT